MTTATNIVGTGAHTYEFDRNWAQLPNGIPMPAAAVSATMKTGFIVSTGIPSIRLWYSTAKESS